jgi:hypothetical protein
MNGNIDADPLFVDPDGADDIPGNEDDDYRLSVFSPCIDAGINGSTPLDAVDLDGNPRRVDTLTVPDTGKGTAPIIDMGAYEQQIPGCPWDLSPETGDGTVGTDDFFALLQNWGPCPADPDPCPWDFDGDTTVGTSDFFALLQNWGPCD